MRSGRVTAACLALVVAAAAASCGAPPLEMDKVFEVYDVSTGWFDMGIQPDNKNRLSPQIRLTLKNIHSAPVASVQLNAVFRQLESVEEEWGGAYVPIIGSDGLAPGASTKPILLRSHLGYTGTEPRAVMLKNSQFVDVRVQVFAKLGSQQWAKLGEWLVTRELLVK